MLTFKGPSALRGGEGGDSPEWLDVNTLGMFMRINFTNHLKVMLVLAKAPGHDLHCDLSFFFFSISASLLKFIFCGGEKNIFCLFWYQ